MIYAVWLPLLIPLIAAPVTRRVTARLPPRLAVWTLTLSAVALAACSTLALGTLLLAGALRLAPVAALEDIRPHWLGGTSWWTAPTAVAAGCSLVASASLVLWRLTRQRRELRAARSSTGMTGGDLSVVAHEQPFAFALPGRWGHEGTIVASSAMLKALSPQERQVLFAHERAHLRGRHHMFLALGQLTAALHPALGPLQQPLAFHLERWADEAAATVVGDRRLVARAIARAALAALDSDTQQRLPVTVPGATSGPVPQRVAALLSPSSSSSRKPAAERVWRFVVAALLCCLAVSATGALHAVVDLHAGVEAAQTRGPLTSP